MTLAPLSHVWCLPPMWSPHSQIVLPTWDAIHMRLSPEMNTTATPSSLHNCKLSLSSLFCFYYLCVWCVNMMHVGVVDVHMCVQIPSTHVDEYAHLCTWRPEKDGRCPVLSLLVLTLLLLTWS